MKKVVLLLVCILYMLDIHAQMPIITTSTDLNLRSEPNAKCQIITVIPKGVNITLNNNCIGKWFSVSYNGTVGYVNSNYLRLLTVVEQDGYKSDTSMEQYNTLLSSLLRMEKHLNKGNEIPKSEEPNLNKNSERKTNIDMSNYIIGILIPILVFLLGVFYNYVKEKINKKKETRDFRDIIFYWVDACSDSLKKQSERIDLLAKNVKVSNDINPERIEYYAMSIYRLNQIPIEKYISIFAINSERIGDNMNNSETKEILYKLVSCFEFIVRAESAVKEQYEEYRSAYSDLLTKTNNLYLELVGVTKEADLYRGNLSESEVSVLDISLKSITDYVDAINAENGSVNAKTITYKLLVEPIKKVIFSTPPNHRTIYVDRIGNIISNYEILRKQWDAYNLGYGKNFENYAGSYKKSYDGVISSIDILRKETRVKNILKI